MYIISRELTGFTEKNKRTEKEHYEDCEVRSQHPFLYTSCGQRLASLWEQALLPHVSDINKPGAVSCSKNCMVLS